MTELHDDEMQHILAMQDLA